MARFGETKSAERRLILELRKVARIVGGIVSSHVERARVIDPQGMMQTLVLYSESLGRWSESLVDQTLRGLSAANLRAWMRILEARKRTAKDHRAMDDLPTWLMTSAEIARRLRSTMTETTVGAVVRQLQAEQVELIKSLPIEAGERAQRLALESMIEGRRADEIAEDLKRTTEVTEARAMLIARTEIAKANAALTSARAQSVGITHYYWRTVEDLDVRESHAEMNGQRFRFDDPPYIEGEGNHGPGETFNCRCFADPDIPDEGE